MSLVPPFQTVLLCTGALISRHNTIQLQFTNRKDATKLSIEKLTKCGSFASCYLLLLLVSLELSQYQLGEVAADAYKLPVTTVKINQANLIKYTIIVRFSFGNN